MRNIPPFRLFLYASPLLAIVLWLGLRNRPDPLWAEAGAMVQQPCFLLQDVPDSLQRLYCSWHGIPYRQGDSTALRLVSQPSLSNIEWTAFRDLFQAATKQAFLVVSGVTGTGATKQTKHVVRLLTGRPENVLLIECAPQFDLEYHKKYIGYEQDGQFMPGELLRFWEWCRQHPDQHFAAIIDNFDKINPETFFGPQLWEALSSPGAAAEIGGREVGVPPNFHLFSVTHLGPGSLVDFNAEHFKRLGWQYIIKPNARELIEYLRRKHGGGAAVPGDTAKLHQYAYYFLKINKLLADRYGDGYQLGQGSGVRECYAASDWSELKRTFLNHLNGLRPLKRLSVDDFDPIDFTVQTAGLAPNSSFLARQVQYLQDSGYFVEITMVATTALLTALFGWWVFRRREQLIRSYGERVQEIFTNFETQEFSADVAARQLEEIKQEVDALVMRRRLNYTEGLYFLAFIEDKVKRIEFARNVSENFLELFNAFMEDNVLTESEYQKLRQFLGSIRHKIPTEVHEQFLAKVERAYATNR